MDLDKGLQAPEMNQAKPEEQQTESTRLTSRNARLYSQIKIPSKFTIVPFFRENHESDDKAKKHRPTMCEENQLPNVWYNFSEKVTAFKALSCYGRHENEKEGFMKRVIDARYIKEGHRVQGA